jgi:hypothetical protein
MKAKPASKRLGGKSAAMAAMLKDPCNAPLVAPSPDGIMERFQRIMPAGDGFEACNYWYVVWYPSFCCVGNEGAGNVACTSNCFLWGSTTNNVAPATASAGCEGYGATTTLHGLKDPAFDGLAGNAVSDFRTWGACLKLTYIGQQQSCSGSIIPIANIPIELIYRSSGGTTPACPTVAQLVSYAAGKPVRSLDGVEVKWKPSSTASATVHRSINEQLFNCAPASNMNLQSGAHETGPQGIGFVVYGALPTQFLFEAVKIVEWRPAPLNGIMQTTQVGADDPSIFTRAISYLDRNYPNWQTRAVAIGVSSISNLFSNLALGGGAGGVPMLEL